MDHEDRKELENRFGYHPGTNLTIPMHETVRSAFLRHSENMFRLVPPSRERSLMLTALEEASMWANAGIARNLSPLEKEE